MEHAQREGRGVVVVNGRLIEGHHLKAARRLLRWPNDQGARSRPVSDGVPVAPGSRPLDGYFFEDYAIGQRFVHATPRTLTAGDVALYIALTGARQPAHCAEPVARALGHPRGPVDDILVFHIAFGKTVHDVS